MTDAVIVEVTTPASDQISVIVQDANPTQTVIVEQKDGRDGKDGERGPAGAVWAVTQW